jgi:hypothetical protein
MGTLPSSALSMETLCFSEMIVSTYESTLRHSPEKQHRHIHHRENLKFQQEIF